jgi:hypothetical protein
MVHSPNWDKDQAGTSRALKMKRTNSAAVLLALCILPAAAKTLSPPQREALEALRKIAESPDEFYGKLLRSAEMGNVHAQYILGSLLTGGGVTVVPPDQQQSIGLAWVRKSANAGHLPALSHLSDGYRRGEHGLPKDAELANCYQRAALRLLDPARCSDLESAKGYSDQR